MSTIPQIPDALCGEGDCVFLRGHRTGHSWQTTTAQEGSTA